MHREQLFQFLVIETVTDHGAHRSVKTLFLEVDNLCKEVFVNVKDFLHCEHAGVPAALQTLHEEDSHHLDEELFTIDVVLPVAGLLHVSDADLLGKIL